MKHVGLGFRRDIADEIMNLNDFDRPSFIELAPENWIDLGGYWGKILKEASEKYMITSHGLSLSIGSPDPLNWHFIKKLKSFIKEYNIKVYSEHLSYSQCNNAHLYDLLPIPFREDAVKHISKRISEVQDFLEMKINLENVSYYSPVAAEMTEAEFITNIVKESDCNLLLDVNNVYVNAFNHNYVAKDFVDALPLEKVGYIHMAGHKQIASDLIIDTHGEAIIDEVYELFDYTLKKVEPVPVLLERDFNFPEMEEITGELHQLQSITSKHWKNQDYVIERNQKYSNALS